MRALCIGLLLSLCLASTVAAQAAAPCARDAALERAAAELLLSGERLTPRALRVGVRREGSSAPVVHALRLGADAEATGRLRRWLARLREQSSAPLRCGEAQSAEHRLWLAVPRAGALEVTALGVRGELAPGFERPMLVVRTQSGLHLRVRVSAERLAQGVALPARFSALPTLVQLMADGPVGPVPVAEVALNADPAELERGLVGSGSPRARLASMRERFRVRPLRDNRLLSEEAERHAEAICAGAAVGHDLRAGDPEERLRARGVSARVVGEAAARATSPGAAMDALERSPSHQLTLTDRRFTDAGIGRASDVQGRTCVVVLLAAWPRFVGLATARSSR